MILPRNGRRSTQIFPSGHGFLVREWVFHVMSVIFSLGNAYFFILLLNISLLNLNCGLVCKYTQAEGYLALENMNQLSASEALTDDENYSAEEEPFDNATLVQSYNDDMHIYDFHIVYSFSYRVPVLYFRGYRCDGHPLLLCDIERDLPPYSLKIQNESKWTFMTQEEHPYLRRPWYTLHPCGTSDWMKLLLGGDLPSKSPDMLHYLSAWLSVVGQTVGLRIPLELHDKSI
ncbi:ubiquitin-like-conjugating enzyme ATG10 isoform X4 [Phoenix dactylifera]|nr:ubiquitin-like-conjugating enzyme ATG10 isoform X4 [Phoenix dactylifera]